MILDRTCGTGFKKLLNISVNCIFFDHGDSSDGSYSDSSGEGRGHHHKHGPRPPRPNRPPRPPPATPPPTTPAPSCPGGWSLIHRRRGPWCIQVFNGAAGLEGSNNACRAQGAVLSSVENAQERETIARLGLEKMLPTGWKYGTIRVGLRKNSQGAVRIGYF